MSLSSPPSQLSWRAHYWQTIVLALPLVIGQLASIGIATADVFAMGQISSHDLASGSLAARFYQPFYFMGLGITLATGPIVAQGLGGNDPRLVRRAFRQGMVIAVVLALLAMPFVMVGDVVLVWLGQDPVISAHAKDFLFWSAIGLPFMFLFFVLRQFVSSHKKPMPQVIATIGGLLANILGNHICVHGYGPIPPMGLGGIALSTTIVYLLICVGLLIYIGMTEPYKSSKPFQRLWIMDWDITRRIFVIGIPIGCTIVAETGMFIAVVFIIGLYGPVPLAASAIANQIAAVAFMVPLAIGQASTIRVGHFAGANDRYNISRASWSAVWVGLALTSIIMVYLFAQSEFLIDLFLADDDPMAAAVAAIAVPMMIITALFQWGDGTQAITISALRGLNDTKVPAYIAIACFWFVGVGIGAIGAYAFDFDPVAIWGCLLIGLMVASVALTYRLYMATRRITRGGAILTQ